MRMSKRGWVRVKNNSATMNTNVFARYNFITHYLAKIAASGFTPLFWAATSNQKKYCSFFDQKYGAYVNAKDYHTQETTLHEMAHQGKLEIASLMSNGHCILMTVTS